MTRNLIFVVGTGRSGTNWMGKLLGEHPRISSFGEVKPVFDLVTAAAVGSIALEHVLPRIFREYDRLFQNAAPQHLADKSHPALWIAEALHATYAEGRFIGMVRDVESTVASMLMHPGVRRWCEEWTSYPVPNRFLGITAENLAWYRDASLTQRCVARWLSHRREVLRLESILSGHLLAVRYEDLVIDGPTIMQRVQAFLGLEEPFPRGEPKIGSLHKWKTQLRDRELTEIDAALKFLARDQTTERES